MFDEQADFAESPAWFLDGTHSVPPWTPLFGWSSINDCRAGVQYGAEKLSLPTVKGWDWRFKDGGGYLTVLVVKSELERHEREQRFREGHPPVRRGLRRPMGWPAARDARTVRRAQGHRA